MLAIVITREARKKSGSRVSVFFIYNFIFIFQDSMEDHGLLNNVKTCFKSE